MTNVITRTAAVLGLAAAVFAAPAMAQDNGLVNLLSQTASVTYGPYARLAFGTSANSYDDARWQNGDGDPTIFFDLGDVNAGFSEFAIGYDWQNGFRADLAFGQFGAADTVGPCISVSNQTPCSDHADISGGTISSTTIMGNIFYAPLEQAGSNSVFQPFLTAGIGFAQNEVGVWTREANPGSPSTRPFRSFEGDSQSTFAWSVGLGAAWQISKPGNQPIIIEASWRYFDLGEASGGSTPLPGNGAGAPLVPLTFHNTRQVFSIGVRIPLQRL